MNIEFRSLATSGPTIHSAFAALPFLRHSEGSGLPSPILALQTEGCIKVVGDIHRFEQSNTSAMPAYILSDANTMDLLAAIVDFYTPMNLVDKAQLLDISRQIGVPEEQRMNRVLPLMDLATTQAIHDELIAIVALADH